MIIMQRIFTTQTTPLEYEEQGMKYPFPKAPNRCPQTDCKMPIQLKKHGFYSRHYIDVRYSTPKHLCQTKKGRLNAFLILLGRGF